MDAIAKALEGNVFGFSVCSVLAIIDTYKYFDVFHDYSYSTRKGVYFVRGYKSRFHRFMGFHGEVVMCEDVEPCWSLVQILREAADLRKINGLIKEVGIE